jgi:hypothetical protein
MHDIELSKRPGQERPALDLAKRQLGFIAAEDFIAIIITIGCIKGH